MCMQGCVRVVFLESRAGDQHLSHCSSSQSVFDTVFLVESRAHSSSRPAGQGALGIFLSVLLNPSPSAAATDVRCPSWLFKRVVGI